MLAAGISHYHPDPTLAEPYSKVCPLSGAKRTWAGAVQMSAFGPKRTLASARTCPVSEVRRTSQNACLVAGGPLRFLFTVHLQNIDFDGPEYRGPRSESAQNAATPLIGGWTITEERMKAAAIAVLSLLIVLPAQAGQRHRQSVSPVP